MLISALIAGRVAYDDRRTIREIDLDSNQSIARRQCDAVQKYFVIPEPSSMIDRFALSITISDSIWPLSYTRHGRITDEMAEAARAKEAYLSLHIPPQAEARDPERRS